MRNDRPLSQSWLKEPRRQQCDIVDRRLREAGFRTTVSTRYFCNVTSSLSLSPSAIPCRPFLEDRVSGHTRYPYDVSIMRIARSGEGRKARSLTPTFNNIFTISPGAFLPLLLFPSSIATLEREETDPDSQFTPLYLREILQFERINFITRWTEIWTNMKSSPSIFLSFFREKRICQLIRRQ